MNNDGGSIPGLQSGYLAVAWERCRTRRYIYQGLSWYCRQHPVAAACKETREQCGRPLIYVDAIEYDTIDSENGSGAALLTFPNGRAFQEVQRKQSVQFDALDDKDLALALKAGDRSAFDEIVRRYQGRVYAAAYRITGNREDALDVAQESLLKAYRKIDSWQPTGSFVSWLLRLTTNRAIDHIRRRKRRRQERLDETFRTESEGAPMEPSVADTEDVVHANEIDARIRASLVVLSPMQRTVFVLRHFEGFSLAEIADELKCTVGSVKVHLFRAMKKLRGELRDFGPDA